MKKVLIVNLTRMGDMVQSGALALELKRVYPKAEITMLINSQFSAACALIPGVDNFKKLDFVRLKTFLTPGHAHLQEAYNYLKDFFDILKNTEFDRIINITPHDIGVLGTFAAAGGPGPLMDHQRLPWALYYLCITRRWESLPFHIVDVYKQVAGLDPSGITPGIHVRPADLCFAKEFLDHHGVKDQDLLIGFNPGASDSFRRWPANLFGRLGSLILSNTPAKIIIFGSNAEVGLAKDIAQQLEGRVINAAGRTELCGLAALLQRTDILITNDTGTMHLAAAAGTKTIGIFMGKAVCTTTGAYAAGHMAVMPDMDCYPCAHPAECSDQACRQRIEPKAVMQALELMLEKNKAVNIPVGEIEKQSARLLVSNFDQSRFLVYTPPLPTPITYNVFCRILTRTVLRCVLNNGKPPGQVSADTLPLAGRVFDHISMHYDCRSARRFDGRWAQEMTSLRHVSALAAEGVQLSEAIINTNCAGKECLKELKKLTDKIDTIDRDIISCAEQQRLILPFVQLFCFEKEQMHGTDVRSLANQTAHIYKRLFAGCGLLEAAGKSVLSRLSDERYLKAAS